jgi:hypothetical protein
MSRATAKLSLIPAENVTISSVLGGKLYKDSDIRLPALQYGQTRDILVKLCVPSSDCGEPILKGKLVYGTTGKQELREVEFVIRADPCVTVPAGHLDRLTAVQAIK